LSCRNTSFSRSQSDSPPVGAVKNLHISSIHVCNAALGLLFSSFARQFSTSKRASCHARRLAFQTHQHVNMAGRETCIIPVSRRQSASPAPRGWGPVCASMRELRCRCHECSNSTLPMANTFTASCQLSRRRRKKKPVRDRARGAHRGPPSPGRLVGRRGGRADVRVPVARPPRLLAPKLGRARRRHCRSREKKGSWPRGRPAVR